MKMSDLNSQLLLSNPFHRGMVEYVLLFGSGILGLIFAWMKVPGYPVSNIAGGILLFAGLWFHLYAEKRHKQAHDKATVITCIVKDGVFSIIRHPLYLGIIAMNLGIALSFGVVVTLAIALVSVLHWIATALAEEAFLSRKCGDEYERYMERVRWRFLPGIF